MLCIFPEPRTDFINAGPVAVCSATREPMSGRAVKNHVWYSYCRAGTIRRDLSAFLWTLIRKSCLYVHPGARLLKCAPPFTASPFALINPEPSQATASKHRSPHSVRVRLRVRVRVGWSASGATAKKKNNVYYVPGTIYLVPGL